MKRSQLLLHFSLDTLKRRSPFYEILLRNKKFLDIGCGEGILLKKFPKTAFGIDLNQSAITKLQSQGLSATKADADSIPFPDRSFELIHCSNVIEHLLPDKAFGMFKEMERLLVPGGSIILITPTPRIIWNTFGHIKPYTPAAINKLFRKVGREAFDSITNLSLENIIYLGIWPTNKVLFSITTFIANIVPCFRGAVLMLINKKGIKPER